MPIVSRPRLSRCIPLALCVLSCKSAPSPDPAPLAVVSAPAVTDSLTVAEEYVNAYYREFPEEAFENGYPNAPLDRFSDRSSSARAAWRSREDAWLSRLEAIDFRKLAETTAATPHSYVLERLRASVALRVCELDLWNVSPTFSGWPSILSSTLDNQAVGTPQDRALALARARDAARFIDTETANLKEGLRLGLTAARSSVEAVVGQLDEILASEVVDTPFYSLASRDESGELAPKLSAVIKMEILPAVRRHREFLAGEYLEKAREAPGVAANPDGAACYAAAVRFWTSLPLTSEEIHATGLAQVAKIEGEMRAIARQSFGTEDLPELLTRVRTGAEYTFRSEQEILDFVNAAIRRAEAASPRWFGFVPKAGVIVRPYPAFQKVTGGGSYLAGLPGQSGVYNIGTYEPENLPRVALEATTFHETYPGHHLQGAVAVQRAGLHPALRYFFASGTGEGWALYTERLSDEMELYSSDLDRLGMLSNEALRAARLVVDTGLHAFGWGRQRAIDYLLAHTAMSAGGAAAQIDRYMSMPGQATAYMIGNLEIRRLRELAEKRLGESFDIRTFHDRVLEDGTVTLGMLAEKIEGWIAAGGG